MSCESFHWVCITHLAQGGKVQPGTPQPTQLSSTIVKEVAGSVAKHVQKMEKGKAKTIAVITRSTARKRKAPTSFERDGILAADFVYRAGYHWASGSIHGSNQFK